MSDNIRRPDERHSPLIFCGPDVYFNPWRAPSFRRFDGGSLLLSTASGSGGTGSDIYFLLRATKLVTRVMMCLRTFVNSKSKDSALLAEMSANSEPVGSEPARASLEYYYCNVQLEAQRWDKLPLEARSSCGVLGAQVVNFFSLFSQLLLPIKINAQAAQPPSSSLPLWLLSCPRLSPSVAQCATSLRILMFKLRYLIWLKPSIIATACKPNLVGNTVAYFANGISMPSSVSIVGRS